MIQLLLVTLVLTQTGTVLVPAGTRVNARLETTVGTSRSGVGDAVVATLNEPLESASRIVIPEGSRLHGRVELLRAGDQDSDGWLRLVFREIQLPDGRRVPTWMTNAFRASPPRRAMRHVVFTGVGAALGALAGGEKARTTGLIGGILGGFLLASNTGKGARDLTLKEGQDIWLQLGQDLTVAEVRKMGT